MKFYKEINGEWVGASNVHNQEYTLLSEDKDSYDLPIDGWDWYDTSPIIISEFELWEERLSAITSLKNQAQESPLAIPMVDFYASAQTEISSFILNGDPAFFDLVIYSDLKWLDLRVDELSQSPREVLVNLIEPLINE